MSEELSKKILILEKRIVELEGHIRKNAVSVLELAKLNHDISNNIQHFKGQAVIWHAAIGVLLTKVGVAPEIQYRLLNLAETPLPPSEHSEELGEIIREIFPEAFKK